MGGRALGVLGPAHQARECRQCSRPTHSPQGDRGPARGSGAGQGASMVLGREMIEMKIYCLGIFARAPPRLRISVLYFGHFGRLFI